MTGNISIWGKKFLGRIDFCWKEIILLKFQKNFFWQEKFYSGKNSFCFERKKFCWQEISMLNSWREIFLSEVLILEGIYSAQEFNFFWQEINVLRSLKDFCRPILLFWKEFIFCWKNWFLLEINMLKSWKYLCWHFCFLFFKGFISVQYERFSYSNPKCGKNAWFSTNISVQFLNISGSGATALQDKIPPWLELSLATISTAQLIWI